MIMILGGPAGMIGCVSTAGSSSASVTGVSLGDCRVVDGPASGASSSSLSPSISESTPLSTDADSFALREASAARSAAACNTFGSAVR